MTWNDMIARLTAAGVPAGRLPVRDRQGDVISLLHQGDHWSVGHLERAEWLDIGSFASEEDAVSYVFDLCSYCQELDDRVDRLRRGDRSVRFPRPEQYGGVSCRPYWDIMAVQGLA